MFLSTAFSMIGLGALCWMLFTFAVYALPFWAAMALGLYFHNAGHSIGAALAGGLLAGAALVVAGQIAFATTRSAPLRMAVGLIYSMPAGLAGFHAAKALAQMSGAGDTAAFFLASVGALLVGGTAWARVASIAGDNRPHETGARHPAGHKSGA